MHTFLPASNSIETLQLPEEQGKRTELPHWVQDALAIDAAVELVCVEGETQRHAKDGAGERQEQQHCLCLYTKKSAYLIKFAVPTEDNNGNGAAAGEIRSVTEPLERHWEFAAAASPGGTTTILRIRPVPRTVTLAPPGSFAVLTENKELCRYALLLHHGADGSVSTPLRWEIEDVLLEGEQFTDFCFAESHGLSLFSSLAVLLLKSSGDVLTASPIVFDRTVVSRACVDEARNILLEEVEMLDRVDRNSAKWRQCRVALQFLSDVFVGSENRNHFLTARVLNLGENCAGSWPIKIQGPLLFHSTVDSGPAAVAIESFGSSDVAVGVAIGKQRGCIDFAALSSTCFLPRFVHENQNDAWSLEDAHFGLGAMVERVDLGSSSDDLSMQLVRDPVSDTLIHYATPSQVLTVSTNALNIACRTLKGGERETVNTTAWISLNSGDPILGVVIPDDATLGHNLIVHLQSGKRVPIDVTESQYLHEFESRFQSGESETTVSTAITTQPFYTEVKPLVQKINAGLSNMGRIVGSETNYKEITPDALAVALRVKKRCDEQVVVPLLELKKLIEQRREMIRMTLQNQQSQLKTVLKEVKDLKQGISAIGEKMERAESNAAQLTQRSAAVLQASRDLLPTLTQAEYDYFQDMKRLNLKVAQMEKETKGLVDSTMMRCDDLKERSDVRLNVMGEEDKKRANVMLKEGGKTLKKVRERLEKTKERTVALAERKSTVQQ